MEATPPHPAPSIQRPAAIRAILLKSPSPTPTTDAYTTALTPLLHPRSSSPSLSDSTTTTPISYIPVLSHTLHPDTLIRILLSYFAPTTPADQPFPYGGIILTSQRAVAALAAALAAPPCAREREKDPVGWRARAERVRVRVYVVGGATAKAAREVVGQWMPRARVCGGERAGSGEALARVILGEDGGEGGRGGAADGGGGSTASPAADGAGAEAEQDDDGQESYKTWSGAYFTPTEVTHPSLQSHLSSIPNPVPAQSPAHIHPQQNQHQQNRSLKPLLFPTTASHNPILPSLLTHTGKIPLRIEHVYQTSELDSFAHHIAAVLSPPPPRSRHKETETETTTLIILFSPLPTTSLFTALGWPLEPGTSRLQRNRKQQQTAATAAGGGGGGGGGGGMGRDNTYIGCIGKTTEAYLRDEVGYTADFVARRPSPDGLREAVERFLDSLRGGG